jgi:ATP-dependent Clp protease ATP-binding subunit ClpX
MIPGSHTKHILITQSVAQLKSPPLCFPRGQSGSFHATIAREEEKWEEAVTGKENRDNVSSFEEYRRLSGLASAAGAGGFM